MTNPDGTLTEEEALPLVGELISWMEERKLSYSGALDLIRRTRFHMSCNYKDIKNILEGKQ